MANYGYVWKHIADTPKDLVWRGFDGSAGVSAEGGADFVEAFGEAAGAGVATEAGNSHRAGAGKFEENGLEGG